MDEQITLSAESKEALNDLIDIKLKEGYLLVGGMQPGEQGGLIQAMSQPRNIDDEITLAGVARFVIMLVVMISVMYFAF